MRKLVFVALAILAMQAAHAQTKIGLKFSPTLSTNRIIEDGDTNHTFTSNGVGGRIIFGPVVDLFITDNYYFSTGLLYAPKRVGVTVVPTTTQVGVQESYKLQYLQLPATLKLFTNELALDTRVYFQLGGLFEVKINEKAEEGNLFIEDFRPFDIGLHLGSGVEYRLGYNTLLFGGFFYNRGLVNIVANTQDDVDVNIKNDLIGLEMGIKF